MLPQADYELSAYLILFLHQTQNFEDTFCLFLLQNLTQQ